MTSNSQIAFVLIGTGLPIIFLVFVIVVTWTGKAEKGPDSLSARIDQLRQELHRSYAARKQR